MVELAPLRAEDAPEVARVSALAFPEGLSEDEVRAEVERPVGISLVARRHGALVGYVIAWVIADEAELLSIGVDPGCQRVGVGAALLSATLAAAAARGAALLYLEVRADNAKALGFYAREGLEIVGRRPRYYADGTDAILLRAATGSRPT